jgi:hypothetical protein
MLNLDMTTSSLLLETAPPSKWRDAADFCKDNGIQLRPEARCMLDAGLSTVEYFEVLLENRCFADARRVLAHAMPKRRALWWGCLCAWDVYRPKPPEAVAKAIRAVVNFVLEPTDDNRRTTAARAQEVGPNTLAGCLAMAAFCSDGSLAPPGLPCVVPRPFLTGRLVSVTVYLACVQRNPTRYKDRLRQYLSVGIEVFRGANLWPDDRARDEVERAAGAVRIVLPSSDNSTALGTVLEQPAHAICGST